MPRRLAGHQIGGNKKCPAAWRDIFGGGGWIRTTEANRNRFTVCPLWELLHMNLMELVDGLEPPTG